MNTEGKEAAVENLSQEAGSVRQVLLPKARSGKQHRKLVAAEPSAQAPCVLRDFPQHGGRPDQDLVSPGHAEKIVDQPEVHDVSRHHHPCALRAVLDPCTSEFIEGLGIQHVGQAVVLRQIAGRAAVDIFRLAVVGRARAVLLDVHKLDDRVKDASVRKLQRDRVGLDKIDLILKALGLLLMAAGPAGQGAGTVDALLLGIPDAVAAFVHADPSVVLKIQNAAFDRVHHAGQIVFPGHLLQKAPHLVHGVFAALPGRLPLLRRVMRRTLTLPAFLHVRLFRHFLYDPLCRCFLLKMCRCFCPFSWTRTSRRPFSQRDSPRPSPRCRARCRR